jgi:hypothetical protein
MMDLKQAREVLAKWDDRFFYQDEWAAALRAAMAEVDRLTKALESSQACVAELGKIIDQKEAMGLAWIRETSRI